MRLPDDMSHGARSWTICPYRHNFNYAYNFTSRVTLGNKRKDVRNKAKTQSSQQGAERA